MQTSATYDLTTSSRKGQFQLYVSPRSAADNLPGAGVRGVALKDICSSHGYYYRVTSAMARRLVEHFGSEVTYYGEPIDAA